MAASELADEGHAVVEIAQNFKMLSAPTKKLLELYIDGKLWHGNHPVMNWNASCLSLKSDGKDNVQPAKPARQTSSKRIDGISAAVTAMTRAIIGVPESPGILVI